MIMFSAWGVRLDLLWTIPWVRARRIKKANTEMQEARASVENIENALKPFSSSTSYLPERVSRPLLTKTNELVERTLPPIAKTVRRTHDSTMLQQLESVIQDTSQLHRLLTEQNDQYVKRAIAQHSKLLVEELRLDSSQQEATVREDERTLVIAAAGSGKTRTLIARVRYLLEH